MMAKKKSAVRSVAETVDKHPAETSAPSVLAVVTAVLIAFGVEPERAAAIGGVAAALTPIIVTWWRTR
jgi:hypothetical protein